MRPSAAILIRLGDSGGAIVSTLLREANEHALRVDLEARESERIVELGLPTFFLPLISEGIDLGGLYEIANLLREAGVR